MRPVEFPEQNCTYTADGYMPLPALQQISEQFQAPEVVSCWELSDEELILILNQIKAGQRPAVFLSCIGGQPPVALWVRENEIT